ncbi:hypothetical protein BGZ65_005420 [Modicella reniformis]|uniref:N-acetyltransferase domain-containing protein n=1 Tax=Modicella reniformis TaxID=1440133 RepID=A0A9P6MB83_9FUNG|nr:hypothetical protein BGZ65_005420 [Modicella reniformis]
MTTDDVSASATTQPTQAIDTDHQLEGMSKDQDAVLDCIRCMEPYRVSDSVWLTPIWRSDASELYRVLNIDKRISEGLYSSKMTFPFPEAGAGSFTQRHEKRRVESGVVTSWAIRTSASGLMIGLIALDPFDHGSDMAPCYRQEEAEVCERRVLRCGELGYWLSPEYTGRGIMSQVLAFVLNKLAWQEFGYDRVHGEAWIENMGSRRVMENAGMEQTVGEPCFVPKFNAIKEIAHYLIDLAPDGLLPILTLCKTWSRLSLQLIYERPIVSLKKIDALAATLSLQDHVQNGQMLLWDPTCCSTADPSRETLGKSLGIDYRALIKKPCRIVGTVALVKQHLLHLWDLQTLLWIAPAFSKAHSASTPSHTPDISDPRPLPTVSPSTPLPPPSPLSALSSAHPVLPSNGESSTSPPSSPTRLDSLERSSKSAAAVSSRGSFVPPRKVIMERRKKIKSISTSEPVVLVLDIPQIFTDTMHHILQQVSGMKLARLHYKWRLNVSLLELVERNLASLQELEFLRPPTCQDEFLAVAELLGKAKDIETIRLDHCQTAGNTVLTQLARSCGRSLRTLEIRQHIISRPMGDHSHFPVDGPEDWNRSESENPSYSIPKLVPETTWPLNVGQGCLHCGSADASSHVSSIGGLVDQLDISDNTPLTTDAVASISVQGNDNDHNAHIDTDLESRMDLALCEFGSNCINLSRLRLQHLTWLSDESLAGFNPGSHIEQRLEHPLRNRDGLKEIELLDSYYRSRVTVEGILDLCGPNLEILTVDRKSCWRTRRKDTVPSGLCADCAHREVANQATISTGDRLILGLTRRGQDLSHHRLRTGIRRLDTLVLIDYWVSIHVLKEAIKYWRSTLKMLSLRLFKCSIKDLKEALLVVTESTSSGTALEVLTLGLPWLDVSDPEVVGLVHTLFDRHKRLSCVEINKRDWRREDMGSSDDHDTLHTSSV